MPLCIHHAPTWWVFYIVLAPNPQSFHLKDLKEKLQRTLTTTRIMECLLLFWKKQCLKRSINSWRSGLDKVTRVVHCLFQGTLGSQQVAASKRNRRKWFCIKSTRKLWNLLASVKTRCSKFGSTFWSSVIILISQHYFTLLAFCWSASTFSALVHQLLLLQLEHIFHLSEAWRVQYLKQRLNCFTNCRFCVNAHNQIETTLSQTCEWLGKESQDTNKAEQNSHPLLCVQCHIKNSFILSKLCRSGTMKYLAVKQAIISQTWKDRSKMC